MPPKGKTKFTTGKGKKRNDIHNQSTKSLTNKRVTNIINNLLNDNFSTSEIDGTNTKETGDRSHGDGRDFQNDINQPSGSGKIESSMEPPNEMQQHFTIDLVRNYTLIKRTSVTIVNL